jgi:hypothetical protein
MSLNPLLATDEHRAPSKKVAALDKFLYRMSNGSDNEKHCALSHTYELCKPFAKKKMGKLNEIF